MASFLGRAVGRDPAEGSRVPATGAGGVRLPEEDERAASMGIARRVKACAAVVTLCVVLAWQATAVWAASGPTTSSGIVPAGTVTDLLPDLQVAPFYDLSLVTAPNGHVRLRIGTTTLNVGAGPFEADGVMVDPNDDYMVVRQRIYDSAAGSHTRRTPSVMADDLLHQQKQYQIVNFMTVDLYKANHPELDEFGMRKIAYCVRDGAQMASPPDASPPDPVYTSCGNRSSTSVTMGISVGYGEDNPTTGKDQWIDVTDAAKGKYRICATVDPLGQFEQSDTTNDQRWTDVRINPAALTVKVLATGTDACGPNVPVPPPPAPGH